MSLTLQIIIGTIVGSWLIALCFKNFRNRCEEDLPDLLLEFHRMYKEDDTNGIFYKVFAFIAIYFIVYPIIIAIIIVSPIICGFVETFNLIKAHFVKNGQKDEPFSVRAIGKGAFDGCLQLASINFKENNPYFIYIDGVLYNREFNTIIQILKATKVINKYVIPDHIISIGYGAFFNCCLLETIDIPLGVLSIGAYAFELCTMLKNIDMPSSVTILGDYAFKNCVRLECVDFSPNIEKINKGLFSGCECLENIFIPNNVVSIEDYAFENCKSLQIIDISENIKKIGNNAFHGCISLKSIHIHITNIEKCEIENNVFDGVNFNECILYVPSCTRWAYLNHSTFKQFKNIIPLRQ